VDVTGLLLRAGATRPHVMIAAMPGGTDVRLTAEEQLRRRGWPVALTPADADVLLIAGIAAADIAGAVEAAWAAVPAPRARAHATRPDDVAPALDAARAELASAADQRRSASARHPGNHREHDMADRAEDRDGLKLDQLHVPLGPLLPDWPAGLVARLTLQGDVVQHAEAAAVGLAAAAASFWAEPWRRTSAGDPVTTGAAARRRDLPCAGSPGGWPARPTAATRGCTRTGRRPRRQAGPRPGRRAGPHTGGAPGNPGAGRTPRRDGRAEGLSLTGRCG
jgi:hypothetical protein